MGIIDDLTRYKQTRMERLLYSKSLRDFIKASWPVIEPGTEFIGNWHIDAIAEHLEAVKTGQIKRLNINIPPRHSKSIICTIDFPTWVWASEPDKRFICA